MTKCDMTNVPMMAGFDFDFRLHHKLMEIGRGNLSDEDKHYWMQYFLERHDLDACPAHLRPLFDEAIARGLVMNNEAAIVMGTVQVDDEYTVERCRVGDGHIRYRFTDGYFNLEQRPDSIAALRTMMAKYNWTAKPEAETIFQLWEDAE